MMVLLGDGCYFGLVPMGEGSTYGFGGIDAERFEDPVPGRLERFRGRFAGFGPPVPAYLARPLSTRKQPWGACGSIRALSPVRRKPRRRLQPDA